MVTATSFKPTVPAGVHAEIMVGVRTTTLVAETPPTVTLVKPVTQLAPVMLIGPSAMSPAAATTRFGAR